MDKKGSHDKIWHHETGDARTASAHDHREQNARRVNHEARSSFMDEVEKEMSRINAKVRPAVGFIHAARSEETLNRIGHYAFIGTGFFVDNKGHMATAAHVLWDTSQIYVTTDDGMRHSATIVKMDPKHDVAELQVSKVGPHQKYLEIGNPANLHPGDTVTAFGHPNGDPLTTAARGQYLGKHSLGSTYNGDKNSFHDLMKLDGMSAKDEKSFWQQPVMEGTAMLAAGASGGPVVDRNANAIGIVSLGAHTGLGEYKPITDFTNMVNSPSELKLVYRPICKNQAEYNTTHNPANVFATKCEKPGYLPFLDHVENSKGERVLPFSFNVVFD